MSDASDLSIRVYSADSGRATLRSSVSRAGSEVWDAREVVWRLFVRDFTSQFRQKILGYLWAFIGPIVGIASFVFLNYTGVLNAGELKIPYVLFVFFGSTLWGLMMGTIGVVSASFLTYGDLVLRTSVPRIALTMAGMAGLVYGQIINVIVLLVILVAFGVVPSVGALALPLMVLPLVWLGVGIGLILATIGALARDITGVVTSLLGLVMYITPVIYMPKFDKPILRAIVDYNPLTYLIDEPRNVFFLGAMQHPVGFAAASGLSLLAVVAGIHGFYLIQDKVVERL